LTRLPAYSPIHRNKHNHFATVKLQTENLINEILEEEYNMCLTQMKHQKQAHKPSRVAIVMKTKDIQSKHQHTWEESQKELDAAVTDAAKRARQLQTTLSPIEVAQLVLQSKAIKSGDMICQPNQCGVWNQNQKQRLPMK
jgi:hypothetical protein